MKQARYIESEIVAILRESEATEATVSTQPPRRSPSTARRRESRIVPEDDGDVMPSAEKVTKVDDAVSGVSRTPRGPRRRPLNTEVVKVEDFSTILAYGVMATPALAIDVKLVMSGKVPSQAEVSSLITTQLASEELTGGRHSRG